MSLPFYHIIHLFAVTALFAGTGAALGGTDNPRVRKFGAILRGVALLLLLVTGFGMLAKLQLMKAMPIWVWLKLGIWVIAAVLPVFVKRKLLPGTTALLIALALGVVAAWLGYLKPF
jgi:hypothetical protein